MSYREREEDGALHKSESNMITYNIYILRDRIMRDLYRRVDSTIIAVEQHKISISN